MERQRLAKDVADRLRSRILEGAYQPGEKLPPERKLAESLGVNRTTLREALKNLEQAGLIRARQGDGTRVQDFLQTAGLDLLSHLLSLGRVTAPSILRDIMEFRQIAGREIARLAARRAAPEHLERMEQIAARACEEPEQALLQDLEFYAELARATANLVFILLLNPVKQAGQTFPGALARMVPSAEEVKAHQRAVVAAVHRRDAEAAFEAADAHLRRGKEHLMQHLEPRPEVL